MAGPSDLTFVTIVLLGRRLEQIRARDDRWRGHLIVEHKALLATLSLPRVLGRRRGLIILRCRSAWIAPTIVLVVTLTNVGAVV